MGGDSPMRFIRFPGEPARPDTPFVHSVVLLVLFVVYDVAETASKSGEGAVFPLEGMLAGFRSGDWTGDDEESDVGSLLGLSPLAIR